MSHTRDNLLESGELPALERQLVAAAWDASSRGWKRFPVGAAIRAGDKQGASKVFLGCNVGNSSFQAVLCAEHNAVCSAVQEGCTRLTHAAVVCRDQPGGSPCGRCRQVLGFFADPGAVILEIVDGESRVRRTLIAELLPSPAGSNCGFSSLSDDERELVERVSSLLGAAYAPYSGTPRAALAVGVRADGKQQVFPGVQIDNASYPVGISAEKAAIAAALSAGFGRTVRLIVAAGVGPGELEDASIDGDSLQFLREFGGVEAEIMLVCKDRSIRRAPVAELLPGSFGPDSLG